MLVERREHCDRKISKCKLERTLLLQIVTTRAIFSI